MKPVMSIPVRIGSVRIPVYFSLEQKPIQDVIHKKHGVRWEIMDGVLGEATTSEMLSAAPGKHFAAIWVSGVEAKNALSLVHTINHEVGHLERQIPKIYGEEDAGEETQIRIGDFLREKIYDYLGVFITARGLTLYD